jgi:D-xylose transport system substrate-binding protein
MQQAITAVGKANINGVYAANDGTAGGAIAAMKGAGINPAKVPVTGQDAELAAVQRIIAGTQYMTVYKPIKPLADNAAKLAVDYANGKKPAASTFNGKTNNGQANVPTVNLQVIPVTKQNIKNTIIRDKLYPLSQICSGTYASACKALGIQ